MESIRVNALSEHRGGGKMRHVFSVKGQVSQLLTVGKSRRLVTVGRGHFSFQQLSLLVDESLSKLKLRKYMRLISVAPGCPNSS